MEIMTADDSRNPEDFQPCLGGIVEAISLGSSMLVLCFSIACIHPCGQCPAHNDAVMVLIALDADEAPEL